MKDSEVSNFPMPGENLLELPKVAKWHRFASFHQLHAIGWYQNILSRLIYQLKFSNNHLAAKALANFFDAYVLDRLSQIDELPELIIPVPISNIRMMVRGYNQAALLALPISRKYQIPIYNDAARVKHTRQQSRLNRLERSANIIHAFKLKKKIHASHVAIIDDVLTTGSTVNQLTDEILKQAPGCKVSVWCMAITKRD